MAVMEHDVERLVISLLEKQHLRERRQKIYIACEEMNFIWSWGQVRELRRMWEKGVSIYEMAEYFERDEFEVLFLIVDQLKAGKINARPGGIYGRKRGGQAS